MIHPYYDQWLSRPRLPVHTTSSSEMVTDSTSNVVTTSVLGARSESPVFFEQDTGPERKTNRTRARISNDFSNSLDPRKDSSKRLRVWLITENNPTEGFDKYCGRLSYAYATGQLEEGEEKTPHYHAYIETEKAIYFKDVKKAYPRAHIDMVKDKEAAMAYVIKPTGPFEHADGTIKYSTRVDGPWEFGKKKEPGARSDLKKLVDKIKKGITLKQIAEEDGPAVVRNFRGLQFVRSLFQPSTVRRNLTIVVIFGPTNCEKSRAPFVFHPGAYRYLDTKEGWFDGYDGQETVVFEDFECNTPYRQLLQMLDPYPVRRPVKCGFVEFNSTRIVFTANDPPWLWYMETKKLPNGRTITRPRPELQRRIIQEAIIIDGYRGCVVLPSNPCTTFVPTLNGRGIKEVRVDHLVLDYLEEL